MARDILIFGRSGQVAQALADLNPGEDSELKFLGRDSYDLLQLDPGEAIRAARPAAVINASAHTAVDKAESEPEAAFRLNRDAPAAMAKTCAELDIPFVHISTDYVFPGDKSEPYVEDDPIGPLGVYGASKAAGELRIMESAGRWSIFRTAWVVSARGANFVLTMRRLAGERDLVRVVADQYGRPTHAADIAAVCLDAATRGARGDSTLSGLFHLAGADDATWADIAEAVFQNVQRNTGHRPRLERIATADYPTPAKRPANSRLDTTKLQQATGWRPRPWREAVELCLG